MSNLLENIIIALFSGCIGMLTTCLLVMASKDDYHG